MSVSTCFRFLRPVLDKKLPASSRDVYLRFYSAARTVSARPTSRAFSHQAEENSASSTIDGPGPGSQVVSIQTVAVADGRGEDIKQRVHELQRARALQYPRVIQDQKAISCTEFRSRWSSLRASETVDSERVTLRGRVSSSRIAGSKLVFIDIVQDSCRVQGLCNLGRLAVDGDQFKSFYHLVRRGDVISITGTPTRTQRGELSLNATELPLILTPSLASLPTELEDPVKKIRNRHADLLVNQRVTDTLKLRSHVIQFLRNFLISDEFLEIQTPILADGAGGAIARPFVTAATEFPEKTLSLRIAPEIWLKRLILGGIDRVFEIGPAFRNEGLDATHNPEFTTCEFYKSFADLEELICMTEALINGLVKHVNELIDSKLLSLEPLDRIFYAAPFKRIEFIPGLEKHLGQKLPDLSNEDEATKNLVSLFSEKGHSLPISPTLPRLLDHLSSIYLEPECDRPTFITHHPACLAPLAKSFIDPATNQLVSARVELFIQHREMANMYEEENSPFEQRRKFEQQALWRDDENRAVIDESYLEALEWGLPPTGGWGCGVDRLCMLFSGASRISDVLSFGSLKHVVGLGQTVSKM